MTQKKTLTVAFGSKKKQISFKGNLSAENLSNIVKKMFGLLKCSYYYQEQRLLISQAAELINSEDCLEMEVREPSQSSNPKEKEQSKHVTKNSRNVESSDTSESLKVVSLPSVCVIPNAPPTTPAEAYTLLPLIELPDKDPSILRDPSYRTILFVTTNILKYKERLEYLKPIPPNLLITYRQIDSECNESVYLYSQGLLVFTLENNQNLEKNLANFIRCKETEMVGYSSVAEEDNKKDHVDINILKSLVSELSDSSFLSSKELQHTLSHYNVRPMYFKFLIEDFGQELISLQDLA